jgi:hypothetical protein
MKSSEQDYYEKRIEQLRNRIADLHYHNDELAREKMLLKAFVQNLANQSASVPDWLCTEARQLLKALKQDSQQEDE